MLDTVHRVVWGLILVYSSLEPNLSAHGQAEVVWGSGAQHQCLEPGRGITGSWGPSPGMWNLAEAAQGPGYQSWHMGPDRGNVGSRGPDPGMQGWAGALWSRVRSTGPILKCRV